jgi:hypothetical protein
MNSERRKAEKLVTLEPVAENGLLHRRSFLSRGLVFAGAAVGGPVVARLAFAASGLGRSRSAWLAAETVDPLLAPR